jgi:eukaryotic-like serine/threonine-protein kinase
MGAVYEGQHIEIGKRVAIKLLETEHSKAEEIAERFKQEGRAASRVESDHVVQVFDVGSDETHGLYMVMEFLEGEDLAKRLEREKVIELPAAVDIAWQAARGLAKAHAAGVIHRDLKPGNIFLSERDDGSTMVKLVDFGISKLIAQGDEQPKGTITRHGSAVGTPQYMSPEQAQGFAIDQRTDVWALGCVLYEMLSGKQAYELLENYEQTIFAIVLRKPPPLTEIAPWVPEQIVGIVAKALEHDIELRIPDCGTFARLLADTARALELPVRAANAPVSLVRRNTSGSNPRIDLDELGARPVIVVSGNNKAHSGAATAPAFDVPDSVPRLPTAAAPPTVTGVAVKTGGHGSLEYPEPPPPKRSGSGAVFAILFLGALSAGAAYVMMNGSPFAKRNTPVAAASSPSPLAIPSPIVEPPPVPSVSVSAPPPVASSAPSTKASASGTAHNNTKPVKPGTKPSASASAAASATTSKPPDDQFGGTGVSNSY